jgi:cell fate (sporulation/competence/biofilm development) regulator YlbF (YheA/YmcA/DUF963 family)
MAVNLHDAALGLQTAIRQSNEYNQLKQMYAAVNADPQAKQMFDHFRQVQMNLQQKQMTGQNISEAEVQQAQASVALVQKNEKISRLMQAEQQMSMLIGELNQIIMKPLEELYGRV